MAERNRVVGRKLGARQGPQPGADRTLNGGKAQMVRQEDYLRLIALTIERRSDWKASLAIPNASGGIGGDAADPASVRAEGDAAHLVSMVKRRKRFDRRSGVPND